jgi:AraC-like DNA-binding protein
VSTKCAAPIITKFTDVIVNYATKVMNQNLLSSNIMFIIGHQLTKINIETSIKSQGSIFYCNNDSSNIVKILTQSIDVIIAEEIVLGKNSLAFIRDLKNSDFYSHIFFILIVNNQESVSAGFNAGADLCITSQFDFNLLPNMIGNITKTRNNLIRLISESSNNHVAEKSSTYSKEEQILQKVNMAIELKIDDPCLNVEMISKEIGLSSNFLYRQVKKITGLTIIDYMNNYRIEAGASLLKNNKRIGEVGYLVGFNSPSYFSRRFKEKYGCTPSEYQEKQQKKITIPRGRCVSMVNSINKLQSGSRLYSI